MRFDAILVASVMIAFSIVFAIVLPSYLKPVIIVPIIEVLFLLAVAMGKEKTESHS